MDDLTKEFIKRNIHSSAADLFLKTHKDIDIKFAVNQIISRQKAKNKLTSFYSNFDLIFPEPLQMEQTSSELTAKYKSDLVNCKIGADLTGGWGVDTYFFAQTAKGFYHIEKNVELSKIAENNFKVLDVNNVKFIAEDCREFLTSETPVDFIYVDPARRSQTGQKMYFLRDLTPHVINLMPLMLKKANFVMIKLSPMLDIKSAISELDSVKSIHIVSVNNECKELLIIIEKNYRGEIEYIASNIIAGETVSHKFTKNSKITKFCTPQLYLYEPNSSLMKLGFFGAYTAKWEIDEIAQSTHLYTSEVLKNEFPGRIFEIIANIKPDKKDIIKYLPNMKANVAVRNYPLTAELLKKKMGISDGGDYFIWGLKNAAAKAMLFLTKRIK
ncbi:MAG: SAM-dependent methyltransferase [bacterium]